MSENVSLKVMRCPTCGATLKAENQNDTITCVYCGNSVVPVTEATPTPSNNEGAGFNGVLKVDGIKTSSSALAYIELLFEEYDWDAFAYAQTLSIAEIDELANSLKISSADDKNTWFVCFKAVAVPFAHKISGCRKILSSVIEEYKKENLDAYSKFDAYKRIAAMLVSRKNQVIANLEKISANAAKYGASSTEVSGLNAEIANLQNLSNVTIFTNIDSIPEIKTYNEEKNALIVAELAQAGIDAENEYTRAKKLIASKDYVQALNILLSLKGYSDTKTLIEQLDKYFLISSVLEIEGNLYYFKKDTPDHDILNLYPTEEGKIGKKPIIKNIKRMISNHADILYYIDHHNKLKQFNLFTKVETKLFDHAVQENSMYIYGRDVFLLTSAGDDYSTYKNIIALNLASGTVRTILNKVKEISMLNGNKMVFTGLKPVGKENNASYKATTCVLNLDTMKAVEIGTQKITIEGFAGNYVVYTQPAPNNLNKSLYVKALAAGEPELLIEQNIFKFCDIIADKLFYYIGNSKNQSLININCDGTERKEWPLFISEVLFEQGGWLYFIRKAGYNSVLCKSRLDGSKYSVIAADIEKFIEIKNGYLYYINDVSTLLKVRMDGSNLQALCKNVESVLSVQEDKIIFISIDDKITVNSYESTTTQIVKSIYAVDFSGSGKIKLAYNITNAKKYDDKAVYFVAPQETTSFEEKPNILCKLDAQTYRVEKLLELQSAPAEKKSSGFAVAMVIMFIAFFFALIGFADGETIVMGLFSLMVGICSLFIGIILKLGQSD